MKIEKEHLIGVVLGMTPLLVIWFLFQNNDILYVHHLKWCTSIANSVLTGMGIMEFIEQS